MVILSKTFTILFMIFMHILDDYKIQAGVLASLKQRCYWKKEAPQPLYRYDYIAALIMHGFSWSFMIMLPIAIFNQFNVGWSFMVVFLINAFIHSTIDDLKANRGILNLCQDQFLHIVQIIGTALIFFCMI